MLGILGVPEVWAHDPDTPFEPIEGGVHELVHREWVDLPYPNGDILPDAWDAGRRAADEIFEHGHLAPGCIGVDQDGVIIGQALPPVRMREVCESLNVPDGPWSYETLCCIESICDADFSPAMRCLSGLYYDGIIAE